MRERLNLRPPSRIKQTLEKLGLREVNPADITSDRESLEKLYQLYPDLIGDRTAIGPGDDGHCQSWRKDPGWWKELTQKKAKDGNFF